MQNKQVCPYTSIQKFALFHTLTACCEMRGSGGSSYQNSYSVWGREILKGKVTILITF